MGFKAIFYVIVCTTATMWLGEVHFPHYGYFNTHEYSVSRCVVDVLFYMFAFDTWFWMTHMLLHVPVFMKYIHKYHHAFVETTGFAQDAVHPFEAVLQGPMGHFFA